MAGPAHGDAARQTIDGVDLARVFRVVEQGLLGIVLERMGLVGPVNGLVDLGLVLGARSVAEELLLLFDGELEGEPVDGLLVDAGAGRFFVDQGAEGELADLEQPPGPQPSPEPASDNELNQQSVYQSPTPPTTRPCPALRLRRVGG